MNDPDLLFSKRENEKIMLQEIFHAALHKCEKQLLLIKKSESPFIQKRVLVNSIYTSKLLLGRFLSLYRCYKKSKSRISTDVTKIERENIFQQTNSALETIFKMLRKGFLASNCRMCQAFKLIDYQEILSNESIVLLLLKQELPPDIKLCEIGDRKYKFQNKYNFYNFTIKAYKSLVLTDIYIEWPKLNNVDDETQKAIFLNLTVHCQKILNDCIKSQKTASNQFLIKLNNSIKNFYIHGQLLKISQIFHRNEPIFGYRTIFKDENNIFICFPPTFSPHHTFKLLVIDAFDIYIESSLPLSADNDYKSARFILHRLSGLSERAIVDKLSDIHDLVHLIKIDTIRKRFSTFFSRTKIGQVSLIDQSSVEFAVNQTVVFRVGTNYITGEPVVYYCAVPEASWLLIEAMNCPPDRCHEYMRVFCLGLCLKYLLCSTCWPNINPIKDSKVLLMSYGYFAAYTFCQSCTLFFDDSAGLRPVIRPFSEGNFSQSERLLTLSNIPNRKFNINTINKFFPSSYYEMSDLFIISSLEKELRDSGIEIKYMKKELTFAISPFEIVKFKIQSNYWQIHFIHPQITDIPADFSFKIVGHFISSRFVSWILFLIFKVSIFMQALKQAKNSSGSNIMPPDVIIYNSFYFKIIFKSPEFYPISVKIDGIEFDHYEPNNCEVFKIQNISSSIRINLYIYQSLLLENYLNTILSTKEASYRFGPFLSGFMAPFQKIQHEFLNSDSSGDWIANVFQEGFSFFLIYKRKYTLFTVVLSSQSFQIFIPSFSYSFVLNFALCQFDKSKHKFVNISQLRSLKELIEEFLSEKEMLERLQFTEIVQSFNPKQPNQRYVMNGPPYYQNVQCYIDDNGIHVVAENPQKYMKVILNIQIDGRKNKDKFIDFVFSTLSFGPKGVEFLKTLSEITEMPGHLLNWQESVQSSEGLIANLSEKYISMKLVTSFGQFFLMAYPINGNVTLSSDRGFQLEEVSTMSNLKSWFKKFMTDDTPMNEDNDNDPSYYI